MPATKVFFIRHDLLNCSLPMRALMLRIAVRGHG